MSPYGKAGENKSKREPCYSLCLQPSLKAAARKLAKSERISLNQLINLCVAEKLSALRAEESFQERFLRVAPAGILQILEQARKLKPSTGGSRFWLARASVQGTQSGPPVTPNFNLSLNKGGPPGLRVHELKSRGTVGHPSNEINLWE